MTASGPDGSHKYRLDSEDTNSLGIDVNAALSQGRTDGEEYIRRWYADEREQAAREYWQSTFDFCVRYNTRFIPENF
ncbi:hypothetical protein [Yonghaparkia sp. Root332]|uniref:hypothetical protein n=1 Tax=Yonghaparkia sp. Root332 TaxID=1736516 RepID=UPI0006F80C07|nr:hypothetical protein [Yonghaparkia sp. Root332]KQV25219.1 hypothetical protein ASC54_12295 [Yonghaparkia sp. Root332]